MALRCVLALLVGTAAGLASQPTAPGALSSETRNWPCPIQTQIVPCKCSQDTVYRLHMDCSLAKSDEQLTKIFSTVFPFEDFYELKIIHDQNDISNVIDEITANTFGTLSFQRIIITGTRLTDIVDEAFADSHRTLEYLDISGNFLQTFPFESLALYKKLKTFIIDGNAFPVLYDLESQSLEVFSANRIPNLLMDSKSHFTGVPKLRELYLSEIGLTELRTGLFNNLTQLEVVDFSWNHLTELEEDSITVVGSTIKELIFDNNEISFVRHDALMGMHENASLSMVNNDMVTMPEEHWKHIFEQLELYGTIDLQGNPLLCGCDIDWLFMKYKEKYLCLLTDTSLCATGEQVIFIDVNIFCDQCAASILNCPPQTNCKVPPLVV